MRTIILRFNLLTQFLPWCIALGVLSCANMLGQSPINLSPNPLLDPLGPVIDASSINTAGTGCSVRSSASSFLIKCRAAQGKVGALFFLPTTDVSRRMGMAVEVKNSTRYPVRVYGEINQNMWSSDYVLVPDKQTRTLYVFLQRDAFTPAYASSVFKEMNGIPGGQMKLWPEAEVDASSIRSVRIFLVSPRTSSEIEISRIQPFGSSLPPAQETLDAQFLPFVDRFGQLKHKDWPGKIHSEIELKHLAQTEAADLEMHPRPAEWDQYGGWRAGPLLRASGHFRTEKYQGKWWLVDPDGRLFWSHGVDLIRAELPTQITGREKYFEDAAPRGDFLARNLALKYTGTNNGSSDWHSLWVTQMMRRLASWGYNTIGDASEESLEAAHAVPYAVLLWSGREGTPLQPTSPEWVDRLRQQMMEAAKRINDDPWCIGFFVDNEIPEIDEHWWEAYYSGVSKLAKQLLPNKLYLGSRLDFHDWPDSSSQRYAIVRLAAKYTDVMSFNQYRYTFEDFTMPPDIDKPLIVGEFHFGALDRGSLHTGLRSVVDQNQRADAYQHFINTALANPVIVGAHWFQLYDEPTTGRGDGENYQIGLLDICDQPYSETIAASREVASKMYRLRLEAK